MATHTPQKNTGFTIVETLVAISVLLISTVGPLSFAQNGLKTSFLARDQIVAFYLAQDVIETIKNVRDNQGLSGANWLTGLGLACTPSSGGTAVCNLDTRLNTSLPCDPEAGCDPLYYNSTTKRFGISGAPAELSKFNRTIYVSNLVPNQEAQIVVEVKWDSNFIGSKEIVVQENIYNWVPNYAD